MDRLSSRCMTLLLLAALGAASPAAADATPKLHPVEAACVEYTMSGQMQNGTVKRCHRKFAFELFEIQDISIGFGGFTQKQKQHNITIGDTIYAINVATNTGTKTANPFYRQLAASMEGKNPKEMSAAFVAAMNFTPTGETQTVAGIACNVHNSSAGMGTVCLTGDGLMLSQSIMGTTMTAVKVTTGAGGDDADYTLYERVSISSGPDTSNMPNLQELMNQRPPR